MPKAANSPGETAQVGLPNAGNIDQIREILVGPSQRDHQARATQLERLIDRRSTEAADRLEKAQAAIEKRLEKLTTDITARLDQLATRLEQAEATAKTDLAATAKDLTAKIDDLDKRLAKEIQDQGRDLGGKLKDLRHEMDGAVDRLDREKTGNLNLGDYLTEIGMRLKGDPNLGAIESSLSEMLKGTQDSAS